MRTVTLLLPVLLVLPLHIGADAGPSGDRLANRLAALQLEHDLISAHRDAFYLVLDCPDGVARLKMSGRLLRSMPLTALRIPDGLRTPRALALDSVIPPMSPEPGTEGLRLRGRRFPLDFNTRLLEGPRGSTRLYFRPSLVVARADLLCDQPGVGLDEPDIRALVSALGPGAAAIFIPPLPDAAAPPAEAP